MAGLQVAALPLPDAVEAEELGQELLALYAVMLDIADNLRSRGCNVDDPQAPPILPQQQQQQVGLPAEATSPVEPVVKSLGSHDQQQQQHISPNAVYGDPDESAGKASSKHAEQQQQQQQRGVLSAVPSSCMQTVGKAPCQHAQQALQRSGLNAAAEHAEGVASAAHDKHQEAGGLCSSQALLHEGTDLGTLASEASALEAQYDTGRSLSDIDAVMRDRGYR